MAKVVQHFVEAERRLWDHVGVTPTERRLTLASGGQVRVQEVGTGAPFVLLHGASIAGTSWSTLAAALPDVRCILVDRPGCGLSDPIVGGPLRDFHSVQRYADHFLGDLRLGRAIDSGAFDDQMLDWAYALFRHTDTFASDVRSSPDVFTPIRGQNRYVLHTDELLAALTMPVLFLWGEDDPNGGAGVARRFAPRLPNAELVVIPGAEHAPWLDDLETCAAHTRSFLAG